MYDNVRYQKDEMKEFVVTSILDQEYHFEN